MHEPIVTSFTTTDPSAAHDHVARVYADNRFVVRGRLEDFAYRQARIDLGDVRLDSFRNGLRTEYRMQPLGYPMVTRVLDRPMLVTTDGVERRAARGEVLLLARPDEPYQTKLDGSSLELVGIDPSVFAQVDADAGERLARLRYDILDPTVSRWWLDTVDYVTRTVQEVGPGGSALVLGHAGRLLAAALLAAFDPGGSTEQRADRTDATPATLRRAVAFLEANPDLDLGVADVARECSVSIRAVQLAFRRHLGTTPMAYLRRVRLDRVRTELLAASPGSGVTVTGVAVRWGFARASRLSAQYRAEFGESPRDTLRRS